MERYKIYHYSYYADMKESVLDGKTYYHLQSSDITKSAEYAEIDNGEISTPSANKKFDELDEAWDDFYVDCDDPESCCVIYDYYTFDDINGYESFIKELLQKLADNFLKLQIKETEESD